MTSYVTLAVAFLMTLVGIVGNTWNVHRRGLRRLTPIGWTVLVLALTALVVGLLEARRKDAEIRDVYAIRQVAHRQVLEAVSYLIRHLMTQYEMRSLDNAGLLAAIRKVDNLSKLGRTCLVDASGGSITDGFGGVGGAFEQPWQLYAFNVDHGRGMLDDVVTKYAAFVTPQLLLKINDVTADEFFVSKFTLTPGKYWIDLALAETKESITCSGWGTIGVHYFNAVYIRGKERAPDYRAFLMWLDKLQRLVEYTEDHGKLRIFNETPASSPRQP